MRWLCRFNRLASWRPHVTDGFIEAHSEIPWKQIKGMRTWFAHQYWDMSFDKIWVTLIEDVPDLKKKLERLQHVDK